MEPYFSIIIPAYNRAAVLPTAVKSVMAQSFTNWELLVIDDGSKDNTAELMKTFISEARVRYIYQDNAERSAARNKGISLARGKYICFLDSDDAYMPEHLQLIHEELQSKKEPVAMLRTFARVHEGESAWPQEFVTPGSKHPLQYLHSYTIYPCCVCLHRNILAEHLFDVRFSSAEDTDLWTRVLKQYPLIVLQKLTAEYYISPGNSSSSLGVEAHLRYIKTLEHIFSDARVKELVPAGLIKTYFWKRYLWITHQHIRNGDKEQARASFRKMMAAYPSKMFAAETWGTYLRIRKIRNTK